MARDEQGRKTRGKGDENEPAPPPVFSFVNPQRTDGDAAPAGVFIPFQRK